MVHNPSIQGRHAVDVSANISFLALTRQWMGRLYSICAHFSQKLKQLVCKTQEFARPFFKTRGTPSPSNLLNSGEPSTPIVESMFEELEFPKKPLKEIMKLGIGFNLTNSRRTDIDAKLSGEFQVEWDLDEVYKTQLSAKKNLTLPHLSLIYKGGILNGVFHGRGQFMTQKKGIQTLSVLLDGEFEKGKFVSGLIVHDDRYIVGTFINGEKTGTGTIRYLPPTSDAEESYEHYLYSGDFHKAQPHGKGILCQISSELQVLQEGEFQNGKFLKGILQKENYATYKGEFKSDDESFVSGEIFYKENMHFKGICKDGNYIEGELKQSRDYIVICPEEVFSEDESEADNRDTPHVESTDKCETTEESSESENDDSDISQDDIKEKFENVEISTERDSESENEDSVTSKFVIIDKGSFQNNQLFDGEKEIKQLNLEKNEIRSNCILTIKKGHVAESMIQIRNDIKDTRAGYTYKGQIDFNSLDGEGMIINAQNVVIYEGNIKNGYPVTDSQ